MMIKDIFHSYVRPTKNPVLTEFCTKLTGITQQQVDSANTLNYVLKAIEFFLKPYFNSKFSVLNDCSSDMKHFLFKETQYKKIDLPDYFKMFINLKKIFPICENNNKPVRDINQMLKVFKLDFLGRKHSGLADTKNIARIVLELLQRGYLFTKTHTESVYPIQMTICNQGFKYFLIFCLEFSGKNNLIEFGCVLFNLHKNSIIWSNIVHQIVDIHLTKREKLLFFIKTTS